MGLLAETVRGAVGTARNVSQFAPLAVSAWQAGRPQAMPGTYDGYAREGYGGNEVVFACIELRAGSASEPKIAAKVGGAWTQDAAKAPILNLLRYPNPFMEGFEFFGNVIMHLDLAGNAFAIKERSASKKVVELWLLRPDQVRVVPSRKRFISHYELDLGAGETVAIPVEDIIHWKTRNPGNQYYGMPPLMAAAGRVDIDNYMRTFVKSYFENAGVPGGVLSVEGSLDAGMREEIKRRANSNVGGPSGWHSWLVLDKKATFTPVTSSLGTSGLVVPDLEKITSRRIASTYKVPGALVGINEDNTSYASMEVIERHFWNGLRQMYQGLQAPLNSGPKKYADQPQTGITQDFPGVEEVGFDLSEVRALQGDVDELHQRERQDLMAGGITIEEFREKTGRPEMPEEGTFLLPANLVPVSAKEVKAGKVNLQDVRQGPAEPGGGEPEDGDGEEGAGG